MTLSLPLFGALASTSITSRAATNVLRHPDKPRVRVIVPVHRKDLPTGTLRSIITQSELSIDEFLDLL